MDVYRLRCESAFFEAISLTRAFFAASLATCKLKVLRGCALLGSCSGAACGPFYRGRCGAGSIYCAVRRPLGGIRCAHSSKQHSRKAVRAPSWGCPGIPSAVWRSVADWMNWQQNFAAETSNGAAPAIPETHATSQTANDGARQRLPRARWALRRPSVRARRAVQIDSWNRTQLSASHIALA